MIEQIQIAPGDTATFICPKCGWSKTLSVLKYVNEEREIKLKIRCKCSHQYVVTLDRRKHPRTETNLYGIYIKTNLHGTFIREKTGESGEMRVINLSKSGLRFQLLSNSRAEPGDYLFVEFHLDDLNHSRVLRKVIVRTIRGSNVSAELIKTDESDFSDQVINTYIYQKT